MAAAAKTTMVSYTVRAIAARQLGDYSTRESSGLSTREAADAIAREYAADPRGFASIVISTVAAGA